MSEQEENELICERLLGWKQNVYTHPDSSIAFTGWEDDDRVTPTFTTWADAGLILEALANHGVALRFGTSDPGMWGCWLIEYPCEALALTAPLAIRAAALAYLGEQK